MKFFIYTLSLLIATYSATSVAIAKPSEAPRIKALLITGGCCHDYDQQRDIIPAAVEMKSKLPVEWTIL
ncbi:MAG: hypothetical protein VXU42_06065, partial [Verrucomicrobiota bacterium]|nr:hypothetical protein [Verrucomicrobiota bacterium]